MIDIAFSSEDVELFAAASGDVNPLHLSDAYARETPYGRRVVYGVLSALASFAQLPERDGRELSTLTLEFLRPVFLGVHYTVEVQERGADVSVRLRDGSHTVLRGRLRFRPTTGSGPQPAWAAVDTRTPATDASLAEITTGQGAEFDYGPPPGPFAALLGRFALARRGIRDDQVATLLACSYLVGMRLPGRRALFSGVTLRFHPVAPATRLRVAANVTDVDERFEAVRLGLTVQATGLLADGEVRSFVRRRLPPVDPAALATMLPPSRAMADKVALIVGGSRGLGAAVSLGMAQQGCAVLSAFSRSASSAEHLQMLAGDAPGSITPRQLDARDLAACLALEAATLQPRGGLDYLILNACPPLLPLSVEPAAVERIIEYVREALALVSIPLSAFLDSLVARRGTLIVVSSAAVDAPSREWPHYVSAKCAVEGLIASVAAAHPDLPIIVARPPRLRTDLTNTVLGWDEALPVEHAASAIVRAALAAQPGRSVLTVFHGPAQP